MNLLSKLIKIFEDILAFIGLWLITILIVVQVANRYLFHFETMGIGDLSLYIFIFLAFLSIAITTREKGHASLTIFHDIILKNNPEKQYLYRIIMNITSLIVVGTFIYLSYKFLSMALKYPEYGTLVKWFNTSWLRVSLSIMGVLVFFHLFYRLINNIKGCNNKVKGKY